ncbi:MAG: hypothetical protein ACXWCZ_06725 [Flavisolibacter sp.]
MKKFYLFILFLFSITSAFAQINTGGLHANFGVDADTRASYKKYGPAGNYAASDDWFSITGLSGRAVIDTANASVYKTQLQNNRNISFSQRMSVPAFSNVNGRLWLDAVYARDYIDGTGNSRDSTSFTDARNAENISSWDGGVRNMDSEHDIVDAYAHLRRNGASANDSLWLFAGVSTVDKSSNRYVDIELFNKDLSYNRNTRKFTSAGTTLGHTPWIFDLTGKVIQTGDVLITIIHLSGQKPQVDIHIWVSRLTYYLGNPALFKFGTIFHEGSNNASHGYANVIPRSTSTKTGAAITNYSSNANADTTYATPWGTVRSNGNWSQTYQSRQLAEIGLNLTRIGLDASSYLVTSALKCTNFYKSVIFKSGTYSNGYGNHNYDNDRDDDRYHDNDNDDYGNGNGNGNGCGDNNKYIKLEDFVGPFNFTAPTLNYSVSVDTITCRNPVATLSINNQVGSGLISWSTIDGEILGPITNTTNTIDKQGTYTVSGTLAPGCPTIKTEQVTVVADMIAPVVTADIALTPEGEIQLVGGDTAASNVMTPFGASKGLKWDWKGPNGFTSSEQSPLINVEWAWGSYYLTVEELRNGCTANIALDISFDALQKVEEKTVLSAQQNEESQTVLSTQQNEASQTLSSSIPTKGNYVWRNATNKLFLVTNQEATAAGTVMIHNVNGQLLGSKNLNITKGQNNIELPATSSAQMKIVSFYVGKKLVFTQKIY